MILFQTKFSLNHYNILLYTIIYNYIFVELNSECCDFFRTIANITGQFTRPWTFRRKRNTQNHYHPPRQATT